MGPDESDHVFPYRRVVMSWVTLTWTATIPSPHLSGATAVKTSEMHQNPTGEAATWHRGSRHTGANSRVEAMQRPLSLLRP